MKRMLLAIVLLFGMCLLITQAQNEGFYTRNLWQSSLSKQKPGSHIECWRSSTQHPNPETVATVGYNPPHPDSTFYLHWWINGDSTQIDYGWDYTFIGWYFDNSSPTPETIFSDYTGWQRYDENNPGPWFYDLILQYETTRPKMPPR